MKSLILAVSFLFISNIMVLADQKLPEGWREPSNDEITDDAFKERVKDPNRYLAAKADFNGDGIIDTAKLLVNDLKNKMGLFVFISKEGNFESILLDEIDDKSWVDAMGLSVVNTGEYKTACGKGYWECEKGVPEVLIIKHPAIDYFKFESENSFFVWDDISKSFKRIWMSD